MYPSYKIQNISGNVLKYIESFPKTYPNKVITVLAYLHARRPNLWSS